MARFHSPSIVTNGLQLYLDAANTKSYIGTGTTWTDLSSGSILVPAVAGVGQTEYTSSGTFSFTVPVEVFSLSVVCVGGGGGGAGADTRGGDGMTGGAGGALCYGTIAVTPGESLTITVGVGGTGVGVTLGVGAGGAGGLSRIARGATDLLTANGGTGGRYRGTALVAGGTFTVDASVTSSGGGNGGASGVSAGNGAAGAGGAGGYSAAGGAGGSTTNAGSASTGGGGGGGGAVTGGGGSGGGGGVGILGAGSNGTGGTYQRGGGGAGSGGANGTNGTATTSGAGGAYGGGGGAGDSNDDEPGAAGGGGAVRIIWGAGRSYPSTIVANQTTVTGVSSYFGSTSGSLVNGVSYNSANGGSFVFDGTNQYVTSVFNTVSGQAVTYSGWLYSTETTATYRVFVDSVTANPMIRWNTSGQIEFDNALYTTTAVYRSQWAYVALSKPSGSSSASYYVNGVLAGTGSAYTTPTVAPTWFNRAGTQPWKGLCSNVQAFNRALTAAEIQQNFNALRGRFGI